MARKRSRTKSGRFTKRRTRATKSRTYRVRRRTNPASRYRKYGRSTRAGQVRKTARRAYRRRNQTGVLQTPAIQYSLAAGVGVIAASWADTAEWLNPTNAETGAPSLPFGLKGSVLAAGITFALAQWGLKGRNRNYARAMGVGMLVPSVANMVQTAMAGNGNGNGNGNGGGAQGYRMRRVSAPARGPHAAASFASASRNLDNAA